MSSRRRFLRRSLVVSGAAAASLLVSCGKSPEEKWKASPGTNGFINLDDVKSAFQKERTMKAFETRVNEIFEGDNLVVFQLVNGGQSFVLTGFEDLNKDKKMSKGDDKLFVFRRKGRQMSLKGIGANSYYSKSWNLPRGRHANCVLDDSELYDGGGYNGGSGRYRRYHSHHSHMVFIWGHRSSYRSSPAYRDQVIANSKYERSAASKHGNKFQRSVSNTSTGRKNYIKNEAKSANFKQNLAKSDAGFNQRSTLQSQGKISKSGGYSSSRSGGFGGFRGSSGFGV
jgi:hypothetical protein